MGRRTFILIYKFTHLSLIPLYIICCLLIHSLLLSLHYFWLDFPRKLEILVDFTHSKSILNFSFEFYQFLFNSFIYVSRAFQRPTGKLHIISIGCSAFHRECFPLLGLLHRLHSYILIVLLLLFIIVLSTYTYSLLPLMLLLLLFYLWWHSITAIITVLLQTLLLLLQSSTITVHGRE